MFGSRERKAAMRQRPTGGRSVMALVGFVAVCLLVGALGGLFTTSSVDDWYQTLAKPPFNPPDWIFAPVWTALYIAMGIAAWLVWRRVGFSGGKAAFRLFGIQLVLNLFWTALFFGLRAPGIAFLEILLLAVGIAATIAAFRRIDTRAAWLLVPYLGWVLFAGLLNGSIWAVN